MTTIQESQPKTLVQAELDAINAELAATLQGIATRDSSAPTLKDLNHERFRGVKYRERAQVWMYSSHDNYKAVAIVDARLRALCEKHGLRFEGEEIGHKCRPRMDKGYFVWNLRLPRKNGK